MRNPGEYDRLVTFQRSTVTEDVSGVEVEGAPAEIEKAWAKVTWGTSQERRETGATNASQRATLRVMSTAALRGVGTTDSVLFEGAVWNIIGKASIGGEAEEIEFTIETRRG